MQYIAPAGTPLSFTDLLQGLGAGARRNDVATELAQLLCAHSGRSRGWLVSSGRAGMTFVLRAMRSVADASRTEVVVPGYTCYSVPASVERAGLKVRLCDVDPHTLSLDESQLRGMDLSRTLCIVTANLYGAPNALGSIEAIARERGVFMLDDAAQALGARHEGRAVGGFGDAGLYSFDKGKNITTMQGGALVAPQGALADALHAEIERLPQASGTLSYVVQLAVYTLLLRPTLYGLTQKLPFLGLGRTPYETSCPMTKYSPVLAGLALRQARTLDEINGRRIANARRLRAALDGVQALRQLEILPTAQPVFARYPVFVRDAARRDELLQKLNQAGVGATRSYPNALVDVPEVAARVLAPGPVADQAGARLAASTIVTLPTHAYCPPHYAERIRDLINAALQ